MECGAPAWVIAQPWGDLVLHRGRFRDGLVFECDEEVRSGSTILYRPSSRARLPRAVYRVTAETVELPDGEVAAVAVLQSEAPN